MYVFEKKIVFYINTNKTHLNTYIPIYKSKYIKFTKNIYVYIFHFYYKYILYMYVIQQQKTTR